MTSASTSSPTCVDLAENMETRLVARSLTPTDATPSTCSTERETMAARTSGAMPIPAMVISCDMVTPYVNA